MAKRKWFPTMCGDTALIPLDVDGDVVALVDAADVLLLGGDPWHAQKLRGVPCYVRRGRSSDAELMHRLIMGFVHGDGREVDHINRNGLDNRRANLREATRAENIHNTGPHADGSSSYKGVGWSRVSRCWRAYIWDGGRQIHLGLFVDRESAARAYDVAAREMRGEFAWLNFPDG